MGDGGAYASYAQLAQRGVGVRGLASFGKAAVRVEVVLVLLRFVIFVVPHGSAAFELIRIRVLDLVLHAVDHEPSPAEVSCEAKGLVHALLEHALDGGRVRCRMKGAHV